LRLVPLLVVAALELLGLLLLAGSAFVAAWTYVGLWAGLAAAAVVVLGGVVADGAQPHGAGGAEGLELLRDPFSGFVRPLDLILGQSHKSSVDHDQPDFKGG
jgi:hypothetical protein